MGDVYHTPQYKIEALSRNGQLGKNTQEPTSEYLYEDSNGPSWLPSRSHSGKDDAYILPPQNGGHTPEIRPRDAEKRNIEVMYDEGHYSLARNSGFGKDFSKPEKGDSKVSKTGKEPKALGRTHLIIILIVFMMLAIGGILAYVLIDRIGKNNSAFQATVSLY